MIDVKDISSSIESDLIEFNSVLKKSAKSNVELINVIIGYILKNKGKQLRPILCLLSAKIFCLC